MVYLLMYPVNNLGGTEIRSESSKEERICAMPNIDLTTNSLTASLTALFNFRVLLRHDEKYGVEVAHCIETGSVVTSDSPEETLEMMKELLEDELSFAIKNNNLKNLFSSPAPIEVRMQWVEAALKNELKTEYLDVDVSQWRHSRIESQNARRTNTVQFAHAA
jgi:hypothetical protein